MTVSLRHVGAVHFRGQERGLPVSEKESMRKGKKSIGPKMKYGHSNLNLICAQTNLDPFVCLSAK